MRTAGEWLDTMATEKTKSTDVEDTSISTYMRDNELAHIGGIAMYGRRIIESLDLRIANERAAVEECETNIVKLKTKQTPNESAIAKQEARKLAEKALRDHYMDIRKRFIEGCKEALHDETDNFKEVYVQVFLEGRNKEEIIKKLGVERSEVNTIMNRITAWYFDQDL